VANGSRHGGWQDIREDSCVGWIPGREAWILASEAPDTQKEENRGQHAIEELAAIARSGLCLPAITLQDAVAVIEMAAEHCEYAAIRSKLYRLAELRTGDADG